MPVSARPEPAALDTETIWREFHESLLRFIARRVRSRETAEDILQDVMLRIHRQVAGIERTEAVGAWVHAIARNAIADHYRSVSARRERPAGDQPGPELADGPEAEPPDLRAELAACVAPLLKRLPAKYRDALTLTELEGLTQAEAAARTGITLSGMKARVQRAREQLKRVLLDCCHIELDRRRAVSGYRTRSDSCASGGSCGCG